MANSSSSSSTTKATNMTATGTVTAPRSVNHDSNAAASNPSGDESIHQTDLPWTPGSEWNSSPAITGRDTCVTSNPVPSDRGDRNPTVSNRPVPPRITDETFLNSQSNDSPTSTVFTSNPLVKDASYLRDPAGYMGPTSTWSFFRRVITLVEQCSPPSTQSPSEPFNTDGTAFRLTWAPLWVNEIPDISNLPPPDYALYLFHTVKFHFGPLFEIVDEPVFLCRLKQFDSNALQLVQTHRLWFVEYLLVLAFGEALLLKKGPSPTPAGSEFAARAMALIPDPAQLHDEGLLSIEILALAALYFHSIDMRVSAFQYIGQALRLSTVEGIHREIIEDGLGGEVAQRCTTLWWAVYSLDRMLSALMGAPTSIRDEDVTVALPSQTNNGTTAAAITASIKLSRLLGTIATTVYSVDEKLDSSFVKNTKAVIEGLAEVTRENNEMLISHKQNAQPSRMMSAINLMYHHCIIQATRPLVMCLLKGFLGSTGSEPHQETWVSAPIVALLKTSISSALETLKVLCALERQNMLESFLPFDLEYAFSSASLLCIMQTIVPGSIIDPTWRSMAALLFDTMIRQGSVAAGLRKSELRYLEQLLVIFRPSSPVREIDGALVCPLAVLNVNDSMPESLHIGEGIWDPGFDLESLNPDSDHLLNLALQLGINADSEMIGNM
ncbi:fungal-specific transcription factor domain-containing protein [Dactylonectria estremocensis]|uniref:Fungal-specific transcription factor domain-containing protein n=1 Tax=Dactylonectria estremocensis TaxID=1079267 RepID=A0A9P9ESH8_9HYPO|nr:fungal-specific transcription factor domain-containing protein [Dactylonectria estremocensis]